MAEGEQTGSLARQFIGQARLVRLLLWRVGDATDIDACMAAARSAGMLDADDEAFLRACMQAEERLRQDGSAGFETSEETVRRLRRCADKLNRADSA